MCLIIVNQTGKTRHNEQYLQFAYDNNPDGFGMMWAVNGKVHRAKGFHSFDEIMQDVSAIEEYPHALHFRYRTEGAVSWDNLHPFQVLHTEKHGVDLSLMHNGTLECVPVLSSQDSDSRAFVKFIRPLLCEYGHDWLYNGETSSRLGKFIGKRNKLVWLRSDGKFSLTNEASGTWEDGLWYSNRYSLVPKHERLNAFFRENGLDIPDTVEIPLYEEVQEETDYLRDLASYRRERRQGYFAN